MRWIVFSVLIAEFAVPAATATKYTLSSSLIITSKYMSRGIS